MNYQTKGTCAKEIKLEVDHGIIQSVELVLGCPGFTQALGRLLVGMRVEDAISQLQGIQCLDKGTSCPDQLAMALSLCLESAEDQQESGRGIETTKERIYG